MNGGTMRYRLHKRLFFKISTFEDWLCQQKFGRVEWPYYVTECAQRVLCLGLGHVPINDQCCNPEHDFCAYCGKTMPGAA